MHFQRRRCGGRVREVLVSFLGRRRADHDLLVAIMGSRRGGRASGGDAACEVPFARVFGNCVRKLEARVRCQARGASATTSTRTFTGKSASAAHGPWRHPLGVGHQDFCPRSSQERRFVFVRFPLVGVSRAKNLQFEILLTWKRRAPFRRSICASRGTNDRTTRHATTRRDHIRAWKAQSLRRAPSEPPRANPRPVRTRQPHRGSATKNNAKVKRKNARVDLGPPPRDRSARVRVSGRDVA